MRNSFTVGSIVLQWGARLPLGAWCYDGKQGYSWKHGIMMGSKVTVGEHGVTMGSTMFE